ncbi:DUF3316 domain-containing protein [Bacteroidales bacterium OttesenSCG-928-M11]|nr:DUF3316 domain-containing protein [Bacteroidales bacterium OttesenSCG-928-M11]
MKKIDKIIASIILFFICSTLSHAQELKNSLTYDSYMVGLGNNSVYDTYLSPLKYKGTNFTFLFEQMKMTKLADGKIARQHLFTVDFSNSKNESGTANQYTGMFEYGFGLLYKFKPVNKFTFFAGLKADALLGFVYNTRNGNNPATPKVNLNLGFSGMATYPLSFANQLMFFRYQVDLPFAGIMYAHEYGQSYYEIDMENYNGIFHFASFHNQILMRNMLSVEFPSKHAYTLKISYMNNLYETRINDLNTQIWTNSFLIGISYNLLKVSSKKAYTEGPYQSIFN